MLESVRAIPDRLRQSAALIGNAGSLAAGNLLNAGLGFAYWAIAARCFTPQSVGLASAVISLMNFAILLGDFGLGALLLGELQRDLKRAPRLASAVLIGALIMTVLCGFTAIVLCQTLAVDLGLISATAAGALLFVLACGLGGSSIVLDGVMIGFLMSHLQLARNTGLSILKLILLAGLALWGPSAAMELPILATWVAATAASLAIVAMLVARGDTEIWAVPDFSGLQRLVPTALKHYALNTATLAPAAILPFLVATIVSPEANASFFAGWMLLGVVLMLPAAMTTVLVTVGTREPEHLGRHMALSLAISSLLASAAGLGFYWFGAFALRLFNPVYAEVMGPSMPLLGLGVFPVTIKYHFIALQRLHYRMLPAAAFLGAGAIAELTAAIAGARYGGLAALTFGWLLAVSLEAVLMLPAILAALPRRVGLECN